MSHILLHRKNLHSNLEILRKKCGSLDKIFTVLKDNAYGHGLELFAQEVKSFGVTRVIVRDVDEALLVNNLFKEILILSPKQDSIKPYPNLIFAINSLESLKSVPSGTKIALKVDTGMHRNGISIDELESSCALISKNSLNLHSIFTHHRCADEIGCEYFWQKNKFEEVKSRYNSLKHRYSLKDTAFHSANSAAFLRGEKFDEDYARIGISMYGYTTLPLAFGEFGLKPVLELCARKMSERLLRVDEKIGYGSEFCAPDDMYSSFYDLGYADGLMRYNGKGVLKTTDGSLVLGRSSMDGMSINSQKEEISIFDDVTAFAKHFDTIPYDILVKLSPKIERKFI